MAGSNSKRSHSEEAKTRALAIYAETGSTQTAAQETGISRRTISSWIERDPEIDATLEALRRATRERMAHLLAEGATLAARETIERLQNGDWIPQGGKLVRRPVPAREASFIAAIFTDKHAMLTGGMAKQTEAERDLTQLADKLIQALERKRRGPGVIIEQDSEILTRQG